MPTPITPKQRRQVLQFVAEHSPTGRVFHLDDLPELPRFGLDLGWALLNLACDGFCGIEDPDIVWSTAKGRKEIAT